MPIALEHIVPDLGGDLRALFSSSKNLPSANLDTELDALIADKHVGPGNELAHLVLRLSAERAIEIGLQRVHAAAPAKKA